MSERLEDLVVRIGRLIQYDPELIDRASPANCDAMKLAENRWSQLPFGREKFLPKEAKGPEVKIVWKERSP